MTLHCVDVKRERMQSSGLLCWGVGGDMLFFSSPAGGLLEKNPSVKLNELNLVWSSGWQSRRELGQAKQSFPGDVNDWAERECLPATFSAVHLSDYKWGVLSKWNLSWGPPCRRWMPSAHQWRFLCGETVPYLWISF